MPKLYAHCNKSWKYAYAFRHPILVTCIGMLIKTNGGSDGVDMAEIFRATIKSDDTSAYGYLDSLIVSS
jgi:hypothetical protein